MFTDADAHTRMESYGNKSFAEWYSPAVIETNNKLKGYKKYDR